MKNAQATLYLDGEKKVKCMENVCGKDVTKKQMAILL